MDRKIVYCVIAYKNVKHAIELHQWHLRKNPVDFWNTKCAYDIIVPIKGAFITIFTILEHKDIYSHFERSKTWKSATAHYLTPEDMSKLDISDELINEYKPPRKRRRRSIIE